MKMIILLVLTTILVTPGLAQAQRFECLSANADKMIVLKAEFKEESSRIDSFELVRQDVVAFAINHSAKTPTSTASFKYDYPLAYRGTMNLDIEIWYAAAKKYLKGRDVHEYVIRGEEYQNRVVLHQVSTKMLILKTELRNKTFKAFLDFRENYDDWANDEIMLGVPLVCNTK